MSITRINTFVAKEGISDELRAFLVSIVPMIKQSQGCTACQLLQNQHKPNEFILIEVWDSASAHQASLKNIPPEKFSVVAPMLASPPSGSYYAAQS